MSTDSAWEEWGRKDPYFSVITDSRYRRSQMTAAAKAEFFESGRLHVDYVMKMIRQHIDPAFQPRSALDFGCGVGRMVIPFAAIAERVVGLDVSPSMLDEASSNCREQGIENVRLFRSDDALSNLSETFDLIHSYIVFQHIPTNRGRLLFGKLLRHLNDGGVGAVHFSYSKRHYASTHGIAPALPPGPAPKPQAPQPGSDPEMQMNPYHVNELLFLMQGAGVRRFHTEFTDHGGELGIVLFFQMAPSAPASR